MRLVIRRPDSLGIVAIKAWTFTVLVFAIILGQFGIQDIGAVAFIVWFVGLAIGLGAAMYKFLKGQ